MKRTLSTFLSSLALVFMAQVSSIHASDFSSLNIMTEEFPPFNYSENGEPAGTSVDLLLKASEAAGDAITKDKINMAAWARAYQTALSGPNVMLFSTTRTDQREDLFKWAGPIGQNRYVVWTKKSSGIGEVADISSISDKIAVIRDSVDDQLVAAANVKANLITRASKPEAAAKMLASDRVKFWAYNDITSVQLLEGIGENVDDYEIVHVLSSSDLYFAFSKDVDDAVVQKLQKGIDMVK